MIDLKANFSKKYSNNIVCSIDGCHFEESQEHLMTTCQPVLSHLKNKNLNIKYKDIFSSTRKQNEATKFFSKLLDIRAKVYNL